MVPSVTAAAVLTGIALGRLPALVASPVAVLLLAGVWCRRVLRRSRRDGARGAMGIGPAASRATTVTRCLPEPGHGDLVMASMGSLAHYHAGVIRLGLRSAGLPARRQRRALDGRIERPERYVRWMLIEEVAEGGDMLAARARENPQFLAAFTRSVLAEELYCIGAVPSWKDAKC
jgi:hypothetical protein